MQKLFYGTIIAFQALSVALSLAVVFHILYHRLYKSLNQRFPLYLSLFQFLGVFITLPAFFYTSLTATAFNTMCTYTSLLHNLLANFYFFLEFAISLSIYLRCCHGIAVDSGYWDWKLITSVLLVSSVKTAIYKLLDSFGQGPFWCNLNYQSSLLHITGYINIPLTIIPLLLMAYFYTRASRVIRKSLKFYRKDAIFLPNPFPSLNSSVNNLPISLIQHPNQEPLSDEGDTQLDELKSTLRNSASPHLLDRESLKMFKVAAGNSGTILEKSLNISVKIDASSPETEVQHISSFQAVVPLTTFIPSGTMDSLSFLLPSSHSSPVRSSGRPRSVSTPSPSSNISVGLPKRSIELTNRSSHDRNSSPHSIVAISDSWRNDLATKQLWLRSTLSLNLFPLTAREMETTEETESFSSSGSFLKTPREVSSKLCFNYTLKLHAIRGIQRYLIAAWIIWFPVSVFFTVDCFKPDPLKWWWVALLQAVIFSLRGVVLAVIYFVNFTQKRKRMLGMANL